MHTGPFLMERYTGRDWVPCSTTVTYNGANGRFRRLFNFFPRGSHVSRSRMPGTNRDAVAGRGDARASRVVIERMSTHGGLRDAAARPGAAPVSQHPTNVDARRAPRRCCSTCIVARGFPLLRPSKLREAELFSQARASGGEALAAATYLKNVVSGPCRHFWRGAPTQRMCVG